jgi:hypothetical protein
MTNQLDSPLLPLTRLLGAVRDSPATLLHIIFSCPPGGDKVTMM